MRNFDSVSLIWTGCFTVTEYYDLKLQFSSTIDVEGITSPTINDSLTFETL
jgi:hypothetical protein